MIKDKKRFIIGISILVLVVLIGVFAFCRVQKKHNKTLWMKDLDDSVLINDLSIPGSHNSFAYKSIFDFASKCQDMSLENQLNAGIRFIDIRLEINKNKLMIVHSFVDQNISFNTVMEEIDEFITNNPSEFVIVSLKEDDDPKDSTLEFDDVLLSELTKYKNITSDNLPSTLKDARGKIYILNRFTEKDYGINAYNNWKNSSSFRIDNLYIQDYYQAETANKKIEYFKDAYNHKNSDTLLLNFSSCYIVDHLLYTYAMVPAKVINPWILESIDSIKGPLGIVVMDFVTDELIETIYRRNF